MKRIPACSIDCATCACVRLILALNDSRTSSLPDDDTLRPPCLETRAPGGGEHRGRRNIKSLRTIPVGSDDIHQIDSVAVRNPHCKFAHDLGRGRYFADSFFLYAQANGQRSDYWRRYFTAHDTAEQLQHFIMEDFAMLNATQQDFLFGDWHDFLVTSEEEGAPRQAAGCRCDEFRRFCARSYAAAHGHIPIGTIQGEIARPRYRHPCAARPLFHHHRSRP